MWGSGDKRGREDLPSLARLKLLRLLSLLKPTGGDFRSAPSALPDFSVESVSSSFSLMTPNSAYDGETLTEFLATESTLLKVLLPRL